MLSIAGSSDTATIFVAVIGGVALVVSTLVQRFKNTNATTYLKQHVGVSNGEGTLIEMVTKLAESVRDLHEEVGLHDKKDEVRARAIFRWLDKEDPWPH